jgi:hypothetical protein
MPNGKELLTGGMAIGRSGALMTREKLIVKLYWPGVVGVPDNSPSGFNDRPGGSPLPAVKL